jgi:hypothetical protein
MKPYIALLAVVLTSACGPLAGLDYANVLAQFHATSINTYDGSQGKPRAAIVWVTTEFETAPCTVYEDTVPGFGTFPDCFCMGESGPPKSVVQEIDLQTDLDGFTLAITSLPPEAALFPPYVQVSSDTCGPALTEASGQLIVYADTNGDGRADIVPNDATASIDRVLGVPGNYHVIYSAVDQPQLADSAPNQSSDDDALLSITKGYNLIMDAPPNPDPSCLNVDPTSCCAPNEAALVVPSSTPLSFTVGVDPDLGHYLCDADQAPRTFNEQCDIARWSDNPTRQGTIACSADARSFIATLCRVKSDPGDTGSTFCSQAFACDYEVRYLEAGDVPPSDWPCPA